MFSNIRKLIMITAITMLLYACSSAALGEPIITEPHEPTMAERVFASRSSTPWAITEAQAMLAEVNKRVKK